MSDYVLIGHCGVDSGQIMIVDPCYVIDNKFSEQQYDECCEVSLSDKQAGSIMKNLAVVSTTGIGDGYYPVYATIEEVDGWGIRVTKLEIDFTDHMLLNEAECLRCGDAIPDTEDYCEACSQLDEDEYDQED